MPSLMLRWPVGRLLAAWALAAAVAVLAAAAAIRASSGVVGLSFLVEFLTEGQHPWLSRVTSPPVVEPLAGPGTAEVDLWRPGGRGLGPRPGLILVHGLTPEGKRDSRLAWTADRLARAGFLVAVPELPALRAQHLRPDDAGVIRTTLERLTAHPAALQYASLDWPTENSWVASRLLLALGGYGEARELVRYFTTGAYAFGESTGRAAVDPALAASFVARNPDLVPDPHDRAILMDVLAGRPAPGEPAPRDTPAPRHALPGAAPRTGPRPAPPRPRPR